MNKEKETNMVKVLVVEDSNTARELIAAILNSEPDIEVVGLAQDGAEGVRLAAELKPDVITMDIHMPHMNGHEATQRIMAVTPTPIVVVTSVGRTEMVHTGLNMLLAGALEIVQKPHATTEEGYRTIGEELIAKVKTVSQIPVQAMVSQETYSVFRSDW